MNSDDSMPEYYRCEADGCHTIGPYMNTCHCKGVFSIILKRSNNDIEEDSLEELVIERNICIYDSNGIRMLKVGDKVMNIDNVMEPGIAVAFENKKNHVLMRVGCIETSIVSIHEIHCVYANNPTIINTLTCS